MKTIDCLHVGAVDEAKTPDIGEYDVFEGG
jgi:hypothetical protein